MKRKNLSLVVCFYLFFTCMKSHASSTVIIDHSTVRPTVASADPLWVYVQESVSLVQVCVWLVLASTWVLTKQQTDRNRDQSRQSNSRVLENGGSNSYFNFHRTKKDVNLISDQKTRYSGIATMTKSLNTPKYNVSNCKV